MKYLLDVLKGTEGIVCPTEDLEQAHFADVMGTIPAVSVMPKHIYRGGDGAYVVFFEDVAVDLFAEYVGVLEADGFVLYARTDFDGTLDVHKNGFATYLSDAYSVDLGYHTQGYVGCGDEFAGGVLYVTVTPREGLTLPLTEAPTYTPVDATRYPVTLTQLGLGKYHENSAANCYVLRLVDGSFIIYDAPHGVTIDDRSVGHELYDLLRKQAPDPENIVITAWVTTHPHQDHMQGLVKFSHLYATGAGVTVKQFVHNFADDTVAAEMERTNQDLVREAIKNFGDDVEVVKPHAGNLLHYPGVTFRVLYTQEEHLVLNQGGRYYYGNSASLVMQMMTDDGCTVLFGGDSPMNELIWENKAMTYGSIHKWYGSVIESDVMTYFHHGHPAGSRLANTRVIKPKIVLWPSTWGQIEVKNMTGSKHAAYFTDLEEGILHETPNENGVYGWFVADDNVHILTFENGKVTVTGYDTLDAYYAS